jgi:hypothetical protein
MLTPAPFSRAATARKKRIMNTDITSQLKVNASQK